MTTAHDIAVIGGGILGAATALRLREGGMQVIVVEQGEMGGSASGVNAGTLSLQIKRLRLIPYALRGRRLWCDMGDAVGYRKTGGHTLAFTDDEAQLLEQRMTLKRDAGLPITFLSGAQLAAAEPALSGDIVLASHCPLDGYANSSLTGWYYRRALRQAGVAFRENTEVTAVEQRGDGFLLRIGGIATGSDADTIPARRLLLACGAWLKPAAAMLGVHLPVRARVNTVSVTEPGATLVNGVIGHATGLLTLKQKHNGTILIGGGWQGAGAPQDGRGDIRANALLGNLQLARRALPGLRRLRLTRAWTGFEAHAPDFYPLAGALPGVADAFVLGCVRGGYTIGPYIAQLMGDFILGRDTELPLFDPARPFTDDSGGEKPA